MLRCSYCVPSYRPHYTSCPSVCLSVCRVRAHNSKTQKRRKIKIGVNVPLGTSKCSASFNLESQRSRSRSADVKNLKKLLHVWDTCLLMGGRSSASSAGANCKLGLTIVRPNSLSMPETQQLERRPHIMSALSVDMFSCEI